MIVWNDYKGALAPLFNDVIEQEIKRKVVKTQNLISSFDIETYTSIVDEKPLANMYVWQWGFGNYPEDYVVCMGRTWDEFIDCYNSVVELANGASVFVYVHNLAYEFGFIQKRLVWRDSKNGYKDVFATDIRKVIRAETKDHIVFKDSLIYCGTSLETVGKNLTKYKVKKMSGDLDYSKPRNSKTPLTDKEIGYCLNDVLVVMAKIREDLEFKCQKLTELVMTNTGNVREELKAFKEEYVDDYDPIRNTSLTRETYFVLSECFMGGFTHCNPRASERTFENVHSIDFTSSYPSVMLSEWFPSGSFKNVGNKFNLNTVHPAQRWCAYIKIKNLKLNKYAPDGWISENHCKELSKDNIVYNGKVIMAQTLTMYITDVDMDMLRLYYDFEVVDYTVYVAMARPLPEYIRRCLYKLYADKTELKDVEGMENEYMASKGKFNSAYGVSVQRVLMNHIEYSDTLGWVCNVLTEDEKDRMLTNYNRKQDRTLYYAWGVWVTAFARANLLRGIFEMGNDYLYSDTDSIKFLNLEKHKDYIDKYNKLVTNKLIKINGKENYDKYLRPKDRNGIEHPIGVWDYEGKYDKFKALRAKSYLTYTKGEYHLTCAGVSKKKGTEYIAKQEDPFEWFNMDLEFPADATGKLAHSYIDDEHIWTVTDEFGNVETVDELSCVALVPCGYKMNDDSADHIRAIIKKVKELKQK